MEFRHERIDARPPCGRLSFCLTEDLTGNGRPDVIVGGQGDTKPIRPFGKELKLRYLPLIGDVIRRREWNIFWYENPGWIRHDIVRAPDLSIGASLIDVTGNGSRDLVVGQNQGRELYWFEQPADPRSTWPRHLITDEFRKYHDTAVGDIDSDGEDELIVLSQRSKAVFYYDIPEDPTRSPWPQSHRHMVAEGIDVEGAAIVDIDRDGSPELVAGPHLFHRRNGSWDHRPIAPDWKWTRVAVADIDGNGELELILSEGDRPYHDDRPGRLGVFTSDGAGRIIADDLFNPHSLQVADFTGNGSPDIYVAEMGLGTNEAPRHVIYCNDGAGAFDPVEIGRGIPTHEAKAVDLTGDGRLDIVGKSYTPEHHVDAWIRTA